MTVVKPIKCPSNIIEIRLCFAQFHMILSEM